MGLEGGQTERIQNSEYRMALRTSVDYGFWILTSEFF